jgi:hypothetical protein
MPNATTPPGKSTSDLFPEALIGWAGHREGGVRQPFEADSGRPTGQQIETPLVTRLNTWAAELAAGKDVPKAIILVGGPGNGKTDAIEGCIGSLDKHLEANGKLDERIASQYKVADDQLVPRKVVIDLSFLSATTTFNTYQSLTVVQDATEASPVEGASAENLLLDELESLLELEQPGIYMCCVNRGILAQAASLAHESEEYSGASALLDQITKSVTSGPNAPSCWPLERFNHIAIWPMDVESLVDRGSSSDGNSVAHQIFKFALNEARWTDNCKSGTRCPFCQNRRLLSDEHRLDSLIKILQYYELASGKRWTFRDIFSLVPYLLVGDWSEFVVNGKRLSPCAWAEYQNKIAREGPVGSVDRDQAPYLLMSRLYHHRLFPRWPDFNRGPHRTAKSQLLSGRNIDKGLTAGRALFRFLVRAKGIWSDATGDVPNRISDSLGPLLDPAVASGTEEMFRGGDRPFSVQDVEERFSLSVRDGMELVRGHIEQLELDVLVNLALADSSLIEENFPRTRSKSARLLQATVRQFAARVVKRSIGSRVGICRNSRYFQGYQELNKDPGHLNEIRKELRGLLLDSRNQFRAGLATTFGQPVALKSRDVELVLPWQLSVSVIPPKASKNRPASAIPHLIVEKHPVPLTFDLYIALRDISEGLLAASLTSEIYSLLDRIKSIVSGTLVRDEQVLDDDPRIVLGSSESCIEYVAGKFRFIRNDNP